MTLQSVAQITTPETEKATSLTGTFHFTLTDAQSGAGQSALRARYPYDLELSKVGIIADAIDAGDTISAHTMSKTHNTIKSTIALNYRIVSKDTIFNLPIKRPTLVQGSMSGSSINSDWLYFNLDSAGATTKNITYLIETNVSDSLFIIDLAEDTTTYTAQKGATFALGTANTDTLSTTTGLTGINAVRVSITAANVGANQWGGHYTSRTNSGWNLSNATTLHMIIRSQANSTTMANMYIVIWDDSGNASYWDCGTISASTWTQIDCTLASPDGNNGTAADLSKITKIGFVVQQPAVAQDNTQDIDHIWAD